MDDKIVQPEGRIVTADRKGEWNKPGAEQSGLGLLPSWVPLSAFTFAFQYGALGMQIKRIHLMEHFLDGSQA